MPWPLDNSLAIDTYYQLEALHAAGVRIHLHYYSTTPGVHPTELNKFCEKIYTWSSEKEVDAAHQPCCATMSSVLNNTDYPILFEGPYLTAILKKGIHTNRKIVVRMYRDECRHFQHLAAEATGPFKKFRMVQRSHQMKKWEDGLPDHCLYAFATRESAASFRADHGLPQVEFLPWFTPYHSVDSLKGVGNFCLYHGDLSMPCAEKSVRWLLTKVFNDISIPFVIAGRAPGKAVQKMAGFYANTCLVENPTPAEMDDLVRKAQINVLPNFSYKKPELKLIHALFTGRHCLTNDQGVSGTEYEPACHTGTQPSAFKSIILQLFHQPFEEEEIRLRQRILQQVDSLRPAAALQHYLFD